MLAVAQGPLETSSYAGRSQFRSRLTLFEVVAPDDPRPGLALARFYGGERDSRTLELLAGDNR